MTTGYVRVALGLALLMRPSLGAQLTRTDPTPRILAWTRLLGARYLAQGTFDARVAHDRRLDTGVELLHAASMLALARESRRPGRPALLSAAVALLLGAVDWARP